MVICLGRSGRGGIPGPDASATLLPTRVAHVRATGSCEGFLPRPGGAAAGINPYGANPGQRFQIALVLQTIRHWANGSAAYKQLRLLTEGVAGAGKSFVIHSLTDLVRKLLGFEGAAKVFAPTGVAAFQVGGPTGHRPLRVPTGKKAFGHLEPLKGDAAREVQDNLRRCALLVGDERWVIGRGMMGRLGYRASLSPFAPPPTDGASQWGGRPVLNLLGGDIQLSLSSMRRATINPSAAQPPTAV